MDDHEVTNNWSPSKDLEDDALYAKNIADLVSFRTIAALEYAPIRYYHRPNESQRIYRKLPYGPLLELFVLDMRSYRGANNYNRQSSLMLIPPI